MTNQAKAALTATQALDLCLAKWGPGAYVKIVATSTEKFDPFERELARRQLSEHESRRPRFTQIEDAPSTMTIAEYRVANRAEHDVYTRWMHEEKRLRTIAFGQRYIVGHSPDGISGFERGDGDTWEEALRRAHVLDE